MLSRPADTDNIYFISIASCHSLMSFSKFILLWRLWLRHWKEIKIGNTSIVQYISQINVSKMNIAKKSLVVLI